MTGFLEKKTEKLEALGQLSLFDDEAVETLANDDNDDEFIVVKGSRRRKKKQGQRQFHLDQLPQSEVI